MRLTEADHDRVTAAVTAAERRTSGEIVVLVARRSDAYHDVALHWAVIAMLGVLAVFATWPEIVFAVHEAIEGPWAAAPDPRRLLTIALVAVAITFLAVRLVLAWMPARLALTPAATKSRRVDRAALAHFRASTEQRTADHTGVLLYLSLAERRAEIVADAGIHARVAPETWGEAMADLLGPVRDGRPADGLAAAVTRIGGVLAEHFPRGDKDVNELPDRLVEL